MSKNNKIEVKGTEISIYKENDQDFISLTDIARFRDAERSDYILQNWMRNRSTIEFMGLWEQFNNPDFNSIEFDGIKNMSGANSFSLTPKRWIEATQAKGIVSKTGRYGGTFAHKDIAFEFASWLSAEFKFYLIKEFQRLKADESDRLKLNWNLQRTLAKVNYHIHTDADWRAANPKAEGNIRDYATLEQLVVLTNLESLNAVLISQGLQATERLLQLNKIAIQQLKTLLNNTSLKKLK